MIQEGGLRAPERKSLDLNTEKFWDKKDLDNELRRQFDVCHSCRRCFNLCDSFPKLFDLIDESETMELDSVDSKHFDKVVDACTLCDMCFMVSCPYVPPHEFAIDIPSLFIRHKAQNQSKIGFIEKLISKTDKNGKLGLIFNKIFNAITNKKNKILRIFLKAITGIEVNIRLPKYNSKNFFKKIRDKALSLKADKEYKNKIIIFSTCYVGYNDSDIGEALIKVLEKNNIYYEEGYTECCKMPQLEQGKVEIVKSAAERTASILAKKIEEGFKIVAPIASCALMLKSHWPLLCPENKNVQQLSQNTMDIDEFLFDLHNRGELDLDFKPLNNNITLHTACHSRAQNIGSKSFSLLNLVTKEKNINVEKCSGHGGTWGIKSKWNKTAKKVGLPAARQIFKKEDNILVSTCPLAALHLQDINEEKKLSSHKDKIYHPIEVLANSYSKGKVNENNNT